MVCSSSVRLPTGTVTTAKATKASIINEKLERISHMNTPTQYQHSPIPHSFRLLWPEWAASGRHLNASAGPGNRLVWQGVVHASRGIR